MDIDWQEPKGGEYGVNLAKGNSLILERMIPRDHHGRIPLGSRGEGYLIQVAVEEPDIT